MQNTSATARASRNRPSRVWNSGSRLGAPTSSFSPHVSSASAATPATAAARSTGTPPRGSLPAYTKMPVDAAPTSRASATYSSQRPAVVRASPQPDVCTSWTTTASPAACPTPKANAPASTWPSTEETAR